MDGEVGRRVSGPVPYVHMNRQIAAGWTDGYMEGQVGVDGQTESQWINR